MNKCTYCHGILLGSEKWEADFHEPICAACMPLEFAGPPTSLQFDATARIVRRRASWFLEGRNNESRTFLIGPIQEPDDVDVPPERLWTQEKLGSAWNVNFTDLNEPFRSRKLEGTTPQRCVYCQKIFESQYGLEQVTIEPGCDLCYPHVDEASPGIHFHGRSVQFTRRRDRYFLEGVDYRTGQDFVMGQLAAPPTSMTEPPSGHEDDEGHWIWDCEFVENNRSASESNSSITTVPVLAPATTHPLPHPTLSEPKVITPLSVNDWRHLHSMAKILGAFQGNRLPITSHWIGTSEAGTAELHVRISADDILVGLHDLEPDLQVPGAALADAGHTSLALDLPPDMHKALNHCNDGDVPAHLREQRITLSLPYRARARLSFPAQWTITPIFQMEHEAQEIAVAAKEFAQSIASLRHGTRQESGTVGTLEISVSDSELKVTHYNDRAVAFRIISGVVSRVSKEIATFATSSKIGALVRRIAEQMARRNSEITVRISDRQLVLSGGRERVVITTEPLLGVASPPNPLSSDQTPIAQFEVDPNTSGLNWKAAQSRASLITSEKDSPNRSTRWVLRQNAIRMTLTTDSITSSVEARVLCKSWLSDRTRIEVEISPSATAECLLKLAADKKVKTVSLYDGHLVLISGDTGVTLVVPATRRSDSRKRKTALEPKVATLASTTEGMGHE